MNLVFLFNVIHGAAFALFIFYVISIISDLTSNTNKPINKDVFIHIYTLLWIIAGALASIGFGYIVGDLKGPSPAIILLVITSVLIMGTIALIFYKKKLIQNEGNTKSHN